VADDSVSEKRKVAHLDLCADGDVEPADNDTLLSDVHLVHCALPELALSQVDPSTRFCGKRLAHPLVVSGMTGGSERAGRVNRDLAALAEEYGLAFGVGSQRVMSEDVSRTPSFQVREVAPTAVVIGNIGITQAAGLGVDGVRRLVELIGADAVAVHLNVAQELTQPEGDRDFRGGYALLGRLAACFGDRLLVKETGCGVSSVVARRLVDQGVRTLDVSGLGGTSWVRVEQLRSQGVAARVGETFSSWGIPTAAAVAAVRRAVGDGVTVIASGGIRDGLEIAKCLALGADLSGMALPLFRAQQRGGHAGAKRALETVLQGLRNAMLLVGAADLRQLRTQQLVITGRLKDWLSVI
jgi:isopentenyl-diphosphate delta-isomerase